MASDYGDGDVAFSTTTHKLGRIQAAIKEYVQQGGSLRQYHNRLNFALSIGAGWIGARYPDLKSHGGTGKRKNLKSL